MAKKKQDPDANVLTPMTFKVPLWMEQKINDLIKRGMFKNKAELIRYAIDQFLEEEEKYGNSFDD